MTVPARVLIAAGAWHDDTPGGAYRLATDFARYLAQRGHSVCYLCPGEAPGRPAREIMHGVEIFRYPLPTAVSPHPSNLYAHLSRCRQLACHVANGRSLDAILGHSPLQYLGALAAATPRTRKCYAAHSPFVLELQSHHHNDRSLRRQLSYVVAGWLERQICRRSDLVHCDSNYSLDLMRRQHGHALNNRLCLLPGWVDTQRFSPPAEDRANIRRRLGSPWDSAASTFFVLRRLVPRMGLDTLLAAAAELAREGHHFQLIIGGEGPERESLQSMARNLSLTGRVHFLGRVPESQLVSIFQAPDCFVLPTRSMEGFGLIVLESYACGVPVIGVPVGAIPEVIGSDLRAWVACDNSAPALAECMREFLLGRLVADPAQLRARAFQYSFEAVAAEHERVLLGPELFGTPAPHLPRQTHSAVVHS